MNWYTSVFKVVLNCPIKCCYCTWCHQHTHHCILSTCLIIIQQLLLRKEYINVTVTTNDIRMYNAFIHYAKLKYTVPIVMHTSIRKFQKRCNKWCMQLVHPKAPCCTHLYDRCKYSAICAHSGVVMSSCHLVDGRFV